MSHWDVKPLEGFHPEIGLLLASWEDSYREWRENFEDAPPEAFVWQQRENGPSIGGLLLHMSGCDRFWIEEAACGKALDASLPSVAYDSELDQMAGKWPTPPAGLTQSDYFSMLEGTRKELYEAIKGLNDPEMTFTRWEHTFTLRWILAHLIQHDSYHGGQSVMLLESYLRQVDESGT